jgi:hypothetical protein
MKKDFDEWSELCKTRGLKLKTSFIFSTSRLQIYEFPVSPAHELSLGIIIPKF